MKIRGSFGILLAFLMLSTPGICQHSNNKFITLDRPRLKDLPFSQAVLAGDTLYVSGNIGFDPKTGKPGGTAEEEARLVMNSFKESIEAGGMTMDNLVSVQVFCSDLSLYQSFNTVYRSYFHGKFPARAFIGAGKLLFGARYEVMGVAVRGSK